MPKTELLKLAERVEALSGPDREVDSAIVLALFPVTRIPSSLINGKDGWYDPDRIFVGKSWYFTGSLDAAMTLCQPDENRWPQLEYIGPNPNNIEDGHRVRLWFNDKKASGQSMVSAALALCAAALRALAKGE